MSCLYHRGKNASHFSPSSVLFDVKDYWLVAQSVAAFFAAVLLLCYAIYVFGMCSITFVGNISYGFINARSAKGGFVLPDSVHDYELPPGADHVSATH